MPQIKIGNAKIIKACDDLMEYFLNNPSIVNKDLLGERDGYQETKNTLIAIRKMAEYAMSVFGETILDHSEYKLLQRYLKKD